LGHQVLLDAWCTHELAQLINNKTQLSIIKNLLSFFIDECVQFVNKKSECITKKCCCCSAIHLVASFLKLYSCFLGEVGLDNNDNNNNNSSLQTDSKQQKNSNNNNTNEQDQDEAELVENDLNNEDDLNKSNSDDQSAIVHDSDEIVMMAMKRKEKIKEEKQTMIICYFYFSLCWSFGGCMTQDSKEKFNLFMHEMSDAFVAHHFKLVLFFMNEQKSFSFLEYILFINFFIQRPKDVLMSKSYVLPKKQSIFDLVYTRVNNWTQWSSMLEQQQTTSSILPNATVIWKTNIISFNLDFISKNKMSKILP
jgi:hypothetical protein